MYKITEEKSSSCLLLTVIAVIFVAVSVCCAVKVIDARQETAASVARYEDLYKKYREVAEKINTTQGEVDRLNRYLVGKK